VLADGAVVGRIKANASPVGASWMWALAFGHHEDRTPTHGYAETREAARAAFAKSGAGNDRCQPLLSCCLGRFSGQFRTIQVSPKDLPIAGW
jgi:hypothetical protein